jgi:hypothetical protein
MRHVGARIVNGRRTVHGTVLFDGLVRDLAHRAATSVAPRAHSSSVTWRSASAGGPNRTEGRRLGSRSPARPTAGPIRSTALSVAIRLAGGYA